MENYFKATSWDTLLKIITTGICLFALVIIVSNPGEEPLFVLGALVTVSAFFMVKGYSIKGKKLVVHRLGWTKEFDLEELKNVEFVPGAMVGSWRILGNGGLFGYIGSYSNTRLGLFRAYATDRQKCVVLELEKRKLVVTPDDPVAFIRAAQELMNP